MKKVFDSEEQAFDYYSDNLTNKQIADRVRNLQDCILVDLADSYGIFNDLIYEIIKEEVDNATIIESEGNDL